MSLRKEMSDRLLVNGFLFHPVFENSSLYLVGFRFLFSSLHSLGVLKINCSILPRDRLQMELTNFL